MDERLGHDGVGSAIGHDVAAGQRMAGFRVLERVGAGGMAAVFLARDERLGRLVALKVLAPVLASDEAFRKRFIRESRAAATVEDPHIIPVYEAGEADGHLFIAMRYVSGGDVRTLVRRDGPLSFGRAAAILSAVASALDAAHVAGLVHRDVKPANMLLDARPGRPDHVYLSDFGLSKSALSSVGLTGSGLFLGTPDYAAPEQIVGNDVDGRADQYALACVAFELLTGAPPFQRDHGMAVIYAHSSEPPPALSSRRADVPVTADRVLATALAKSPSDRFPSCQDFAASLRTSLRLAAYDAEPSALPVPQVRVNAAALAGSRVASRHEGSSTPREPGGANTLAHSMETGNQQTITPRDSRASNQQDTEGDLAEKSQIEATRRHDQQRVSHSARPSMARSAGSNIEGWRGRRSLSSVFAVMAVSLLVLSGLGMATSYQRLVGYQQVGSLASLSSNVTRLAYELEYERDNTVWFISMKTGSNGRTVQHMSAAAQSQLQVVRQQYVHTDQTVRPVRQSARAIGSAFPAGVELDAQSVLAEIGFIPSVRTAALSADASAADVISRYERVIGVLLAFEGQIALTSNDPQLTSTVSALSQISRIQDEFSIQRGLIVFSLTAAKFAPNMFQMLNASVANQASDSAQFQSFASPGQLNLYKIALANGSLADRVSGSESTIIRYQPAHNGSLSGIGIPSEVWFGDVTTTIGKVRFVELTLLRSVRSRSTELSNNAMISLTLLGVLVAMQVLIFGILFRATSFRPVRAAARLWHRVQRLVGTGRPRAA